MLIGSIVRLPSNGKGINRYDGKMDISDDVVEVFNILSNIDISDIKADEVDYEGRDLIHLTKHNKSMYTINKDYSALFRSSIENVFEFWVNSTHIFEVEFTHGKENKVYYKPVGYSDGSWLGEQPPVSKFKQEIFSNHKNEKTWFTLSVSDTTNFINYHINGMERYHVDIRNENLMGDVSYNLVHMFTIQWADNR